MVQKQKKVSLKRTVYFGCGLLSLLRLSGDEVVELAPLIVEGRHFDEMAMELPLGVKRLGREEIQGSGWRSVPELLERLGGVRFIDPTGNGTSGQVALRGFGDNSGLRVLIIVDGQIYNPPDMGGINWDGIEMEQLETVEILRGGQTVLYGNHAVAGVIKLTTLQYDEGLNGSLVLATGSDQFYAVKASGNSRSGNLGIGVGGSWRETEGFRDHSSLSGESGYASWNWQAAEGQRWAGKIHYNVSEMQFPGPLSYDEMLAEPRMAKEGVNDELESEVLQLTQHGEGRNSWGVWEVSAGFLSRKREWNLDGLAADNELERITLNPRVKFGDKGNYLMTGADFSWDKVSHLGFWDMKREIILSQADLERITAGGYVFVSIDLMENLTWSGGVRIESANTDNDYVEYIRKQLLPEIETNRGVIPNPDYRNPPDADPELSFSGPVDKSGLAGEASLVWLACDHLSLWTGWDRVYRYPSLDEAAAYQGYPLSDPLNENLEPETGDNFEIGIKSDYLNWYIGVTAFYLMLDDEISFVEYDDGNGLARLNENIGDSERKGLELDISYQAGRYGFNLIASIIDVSLERNGEQVTVPLVPESEASLSVWVKPLQDLKIQLQGRYQASQVQGNDFDLSNRRIPSYCLANLTVNWDVADGYSAVLGVNNLMDKTHAVTAYSGGFYPGAGRQVFLSVKIEF